MAGDAPQHESGRLDEVNASPDVTEERGAHQGCGAVLAIAPAPADAVARALEAAAEGWRTDADRRTLRRQLLALLAELE